MATEVLMPKLGLTMTEGTMDVLWRTPYAYSTRMEGAFPVRRRRP